MFQIDERGVLRVADWDRYPWLSHGFSTRGTADFSNRPPEREILGAFGAHGFRTATLKQVHSATTVTAHASTGAEPPSADALVTDRRGLLLGIRVADCVPVLVVDPALGAVAAVHAGWRGAVAGVLLGALAALEAEYGSRLTDLECAIGPAIGPCCFEVGDEVAERFRSDFVDRSRSRPHVDLVGMLRAQLLAEGVCSVAVLNECTACDIQKYYSHRGERGQAGRMLAVVGLRETAT